MESIGWGNKGATIGKEGSEGGTILLDKEYRGACRITLERVPGHYAITAGVYGLMVHTAFFLSHDDAIWAFEEMQDEMTKFIDEHIDRADEWCEFFTEKFK